MTQFILLFAVAVVGIFAQAFQSRNINGGHYVLAAIGSIFIGLTQAYIWKAITPENAGLAQTLVYAVGGGTGCILAMWTHRRFVKEKPRG